MDDGVVDEWHAFLAVSIPTLGVLLVRCIKIGIGPESPKKRSFVIRRATQPTIGQPRPGGDRIARGYLLLDRAGSDEIAMSETAPLGQVKMLWPLL
jgi:hypothetical protein